MAIFLFGIDDGNSFGNFIFDGLMVIVRTVKQGQDYWTAIAAQAPPGKPAVAKFFSGRNPPPILSPMQARVAAFFDLDKTVVATSSALAFGRHFYANGLINLRHRMTRIGGQCDISSRTGGGVVVRLGLPLAGH